MMNDASREDQQKSSQDALTRREDAWEEVLIRAAKDEDGEFATTRGNQPPPPNRDLWRWVKAALPLAVVLIYIAVKSFDGWGDRSGAWPRTVQQPKSLTGVEPTAADAPKIDRATRAFIADLEKLMNEGSLPAVRDKITSADNTIKSNPIVQAIYVVVRTQQGEMNASVERQLMVLESQLGAAEGDFPNLLQEVRVARAAQILSRCNDSESLSRNTDTILQLLGPTPKSKYGLDVRVRAAGNFEQVGNRLIEQGKGMIRTDVLKVREARAFYQTGLRFIVADDAWLQLKPVTPRAAPDVERIAERIREANKMINGLSIPFGDSDSTTWTGKKGDPVHDLPASGK